jgi:D-ribose pyranose/furanose isomerase RbsD
MKLLFVFFGVLGALAVLIAAEFSVEGDPLYVVKTTINDRFHVYQETTPPTAVATDTLEVSEALRSQLNESFPSDMAAFLVRLRTHTSELRDVLTVATSTLEVDEIIVLEVVNEADNAIDKALVALEEKKYEAAEAQAEVAVMHYITAKTYLE